VCLSWAAWALWFLGYPDQALKRSQEALTVARGLSHPYSLSVILTFAVWLHQCRRDGQATQEQAEALITLSNVQGFPLPLAHGTVSRGWALAEQGQSEEGISQVRQGLAACQAVGAGMSRSYYLALLAEAYGKAGKIEEGLIAVAEALAVIDKTGERFYEAELYRLKGELLLAQEIKRQKAKGKNQKIQIRNPHSPIRNRKPKRVFIKPSTLPVSNKPNPGNCA
jgi:predicted ATPase